MYSLTKKLSVDKTRLLLDGAHFPFQGVSFFNALFNEGFNESDETVSNWLNTFKKTGINALRIWCTWNLPSPCNTFVDTGPDACLFTFRGDIKPKYADRLLRLLELCDKLDMVVETAALCQEKFALYQPKAEHYPDEIIPVQEMQLEALAKLTLPYRNHIFQIWNESSFEVIRYFNVVKSIDPEKIVTNSPGGAGNLGDERQNRLMDILTPHTYRRGNQGTDFWEVAAEQVKSLLEKYKKPVIDDEPARGGLIEHGGIEGGTEPEQHIGQITAVRSLGGYHTYHHDMFQNGYNHPATPGSGIPEPGFSVHKQVFDYLRQNPY